jgi:hypothetical protein
MRAHISAKAKFSHVTMHPDDYIPEIDYYTRHKRNLNHLIDDGEYANGDRMYFHNR